MNRQTAAQTQRLTVAAATSGILNRVAVRSVLDHAIRSSSGGNGHTSYERRLGNDFSGVAVHSARGEQASIRPVNVQARAREQKSESKSVTDGFIEPEEGFVTDQPVVATAAPPIPAPAPPAPPGGPAMPATAAALTVTLLPHIRGTTSPAGMADRIPPRVDTPVKVGITGFQKPMAPITLSIDGAGGSNGDATIDGAATRDLTASATCQLRGTTQTEVGSAGRLKLVARQGATIRASSSGFSVSSIPQDVSISFRSLLVGSRRGVQVNTSWGSDSGSRADLDAAEFSESVQSTSATGCFVGARPLNSGFLPANIAPLTDTHGTPVSILTGPGSRIASQTFKFNDKRSGSTDVPMRNSGYLITRTVTAPAAGPLQITTEKHGAATTANGVASNAGSGSVSRTQAV
jgi:hypothetical protein